jgi:hypothetical protein
LDVQEDETPLHLLIRTFCGKEENLRDTVGLLIEEGAYFHLKNKVGSQNVLAHFPHIFTHSFSIKFLFCRRGGMLCTWFSTTYRDAKGVSEMTFSQGSQRRVYLQTRSWNKKPRMKSLTPKML